MARGPQRREAVTAPPNATERDEEDGGERPFTRHGRGVACALERLADLLIKGQMNSEGRLGSSARLQYGGTRSGSKR